MTVNNMPEAQNTEPVIKPVRKLAPSEYKTLEGLVTSEQQAQVKLARVTYAAHKAEQERRAICADLDNISANYQKFQADIAKSYDLKGPFSIQPDGTITEAVSIA